MNNVVFLTNFLIKAVYNVFICILYCVHEELDSAPWESPGSLLEFMNARLSGFYVPQCFGV